MRQLLAHNSWWSYSQSSRRGEGDLVAVLLTVFLLAALGPLVCTFLCQSAQGTPVTTHAIGASQTIGSPGVPSPDIPAGAGVLHCLAHHPCCQFGPLLAVISLSPLLVVVRLVFCYVLIAPQPGSAPATPPPQLSYC